MAGDERVLAAALRWAEEGRRCALVTVARTWGSAPRPPGAWLALCEDGRMEGSVSGGCIEEDLVARWRDQGFGGDAPFTLRYGVTRDEAARFGLPCGGTLELVVEPAPDASLLRALGERLARRELTLRVVDVPQGTVALSDATRDDAFAWDGARLVTVHGPRWRLFLVGAGEIARVLAAITQPLGYRVIVCDPRAEVTDGWDVPGTELTRAMPDDAFQALAPDARTAVVALTHDPKLDDLALLEALKSPAFYVGALGSRASSARRRERLAEHFALTETQLSRLHGPVGLAIGSRTPPEIAVSIAAHLVAVRNGVQPS
jgi:xanthine dehydrogenase accessory factor